MNDLIRGAVSGLAGTVVMSAAMAATRLAGTMRGEVPPRQITGNVEESVGLREQLDRPAFEASWVVQHFAYGAAAGVGYTLLQRRLRLREPLPAGPLYGISLWAVSYAGWLPAVGLYPPPDRDRADRVVNMIVHHLVYGTVTAQVNRALRRRSGTDEIPAHRDHLLVS